MPDRRKLVSLERLLCVQRIKRIDAEAALADARELEREARSIEEAVQAKSRAADEQWLDYVARPGFSPEHSRGLCSHILDCDEKVHQAAATTLRISEDTSRKVTVWQQSLAQFSLTEGSTRRLRRGVDRKREEERLAEIADRMTFNWNGR